ASRNQPRRRAAKDSAHIRPELTTHGDFRHKWHDRVASRSPPNVVLQHARARAKLSEFNVSALILLVPQTRRAKLLGVAWRRRARRVEQLFQQWSRRAPVGLRRSACQ